MQTTDKTLADLMLEAASVCEAMAAADAAQRRGEPIAIWRESIAVQLEDLAEEVRAL